MKLHRIICMLLLSLIVTSLQAKNNQSYYFQRAEEAYQQEDYDESIRISLLGVEANPKDGYCWAMLAEIYSKRAYARYAESLEAAEKALKYIPKKDVTWQAFMNSILGDVYYKVEDFQASKQAYSRAMQLDKERDEYRISYADVCYALGEYEEGIRIYKQLVDDKGTPAYGYAELAEGYYHLGRIEEAKTACRMAILLTDDENYKAHHLLALIAIREGRLHEACREEAHALALEDEAGTGVTDTLFYLCHELMDAAVLNELQKTVTDAEAHIHAANYFFASKDYGRMLYHMQQAERYGTEHSDLYSAYSLAYRQLGDYDRALQYMQEWMATDSLKEEHKAFFHNALASLYRDCDQAELAIHHSLQDLAADPEDGDTYRMIGRCKIMLSDLEGALVYMDSAVMVAEEKDLPTCLFNRAEVHRRMGNEEAARQDCEEALRYRNRANQDRVTFLFAEAILGQREQLDHYTDSILSLQSLVNRYDAMLDLMGCYALLRDKERLLQLAELHFRLGYRNLIQLRSFFRFDWLRDDPDWLALLDRWEAVRLADLKRAEDMTRGEQNEQGVTELPFTREGGVCKVKCTINGLPLYFVFDTGASDVTISSVEANFMLKEGYLSEADFLGKQNYVTATGEIHEGTIINLREVRVGEVVLRDVKASVVKSQHAPLLLGQTVFRRFGTLEVDNNASIIRFRK
ncbi:MAG: retroviral-like aspartic protease family protein [Paludibacteraceae bacterium]|nr:retroviral-like aspartic protease family protein [Paludibacteraceae bacterium]